MDPNCRLMVFSKKGRLGKERKDRFGEVLIVKICVFHHFWVFLTLYLTIPICKPFSFYPSSQIFSKKYWKISDEPYFWRILKYWKYLTNNLYEKYVTIYFYRKYLTKYLWRNISNKFSWRKYFRRNIYDGNVSVEISMTKILLTKYLWREYCWSNIFEEIIVDQLSSSPSRSNSCYQC